MSDLRAPASGLLRVALLVAALLPAPLRAAPPRVVVRQVLDTSPLGDPFVFDVSPDGAVVVLTADNVHDVGSGANVFGAPLKDPAWLAFGGGKLRLIADDGLYVVDGRAPRRLVEVPLRGRVFATDGGRTFVAGVDGDGTPLLFLYEEGKGHKPLLRLDAPIDAMAVAGGALFFTAGPRIYALGEGGPARLLASLPDLPRIPSIAVDERRGLLYFSEGEAIYALRGDDFVVVRRGMGGMLRARGDDLYVLSWRDHALVQLAGLSAALVAHGALAPLEDPCADPIVGLHCRAGVERALLAGAGDRSTRGEDAAALAAFVTVREEALRTIDAALAKEAKAGKVGVLWTSDAEPRAVAGGGPFETKARGAAISLWDGSELRLGPDSRLVLGGCRPPGGCDVALERGLLHVASRGAAGRTFAVASGALRLAFEEARVAVFADADQAAVLVLEGRVQATAAGQRPVTVGAGELLEARRGQPVGVPVATDPGRVNRWWETLR